MNLLHLKYATVIAETNSMTKAAEVLFTAQPNLSRAVKELETSLGINIFRRTPKGIFPTAEGEEFLAYARNILAQADAMEAMYKSSAAKVTTFSISVPHSYYIAAAFAKFADSQVGSQAELIYNETSPLRVVANVADGDYDLGILRYANANDPTFKALLKDKNLSFEIICEFEPVILLSKRHPLAKQQTLADEDLAPFTELAYADPNAPTLQLSTARKTGVDVPSKRKIFVFDRANIATLLCQTTGSFMWSCPMPAEELKRQELVQLANTKNRMHRDVLIYQKRRSLTKLDNAFIDELMKVKRSMNLHCE